MKPIKGVLTLIGTLAMIVTLSACNLPLSKQTVPSTSESQKLALTMVAQTMQAEVTSTSAPMPTPTVFNPIVNVSFAVEAYNAAGASPQRTISFTCQ